MCVVRGFGYAMLHAAEVPYLQLRPFPPEHAVRQGRDEPDLRTTVRQRLLVFVASNRRCWRLGYWTGRPWPTLINLVRA